jgi:hypothetical protein
MKVVAGYCLFFMWPNPQQCNWTVFTVLFRVPEKKKRKDKTESWMLVGSGGQTLVTS